MLRKQTALRPSQEEFGQTVIPNQYQSSEQFPESMKQAPIWLRLLPFLLDKNNRQRLNWRLSKSLLVWMRNVSNRQEVKRLRRELKRLAVARRVPAPSPHPDAFCFRSSSPFFCGFYDATTGNHLPLSTHSLSLQTSVLLKNVLTLVFLTSLHLSSKTQIKDISMHQACPGTDNYSFCFVPKHRSQPRNTSSNVTF